LTLNPTITLRRTMSRLIACLVAAAVLAGCGFAAAPEQSGAALPVGIGDQDPSMFTDPLFEQAGLEKARYFPSWNVALKGHEREAGWLQAWLDGPQGTRHRPAD